MSDSGDKKNHEQGASGFAGPSQSHVLPPAEPEGSDQKNAAASKRERLTQALEGFSSVFEFVVAFAALVGLALVGIQIYYLGRSDHLSREALRLTRENNASSDRTSTQILEKMEASNKLTRDAMNESQREASASLKESERLNALTADMVSQAKRQSEGARKALDFSKQSMRESLRAQVLVETVTVDLEHSPCQMLAILRNAGSIPAESFAAGVQWAVGDPSAMPQPTLIQTANPMIQGSEYNYTPNLEIPERSLADVKTGSLPLRVWVVFEYGDRLTSSYGVTSACFTYRIKGKDFTACRADEARKPTGGH